MVLYMAKSIKSSIARSLSGNMSLNRKSLNLKRSWEDVEKILQSVGTKKKKQHWRKIKWHLYLQMKTLSKRHYKVSN